MLHLKRTALFKKKSKIEIHLSLNVSSEEEADFINAIRRNTTRPHITVLLSSLENIAMVNGLVTMANLVEQQGVPMLGVLRESSHH